MNPEFESIICSVLDESYRPPMEEVVRWLGDGDIEVAGFASVLLLEHCDKIEGEASLSDVLPPLLRHAERCIRVDPVGEWTSSRYEAARLAHGLFESYWNSSQEARDYACPAIKSWIADLLHACPDPRVRDAIVCGALEHVLERKEARGLFKDWEASDPILRKAHEDAMAWARDHSR